MHAYEQLPARLSPVDIWPYEAVQVIGCAPAATDLTSLGLLVPSVVASEGKRLLFAYGYP